MEESSDDDGIVDDILEGLTKENTIKLACKDKNPRKKENQATLPDASTSSDLEIILNDVEIVFEEGLDINNLDIGQNPEIFQITDLLTEREVVVIDHTIEQSKSTDDNVGKQCPNHEYDDKTPENEDIAKNSGYFELEHLFQSDEDANLNEEIVESQDPDYNPENEESHGSESEDEVRGNSTVVESQEVTDEIQILTENVNNLTQDTVRKRRKKSNSKEWDISITKRLRETGKSYVGFERKKHEDSGKYVVKRSNKREERKMGPRCNTKICNSNKKRKCNEVTDTHRNEIFKSFWGLSWKEKEAMVNSLVSITGPKKRTVKTTSRRSGTLFYHLKANRELKPVCKKFFLHTLGINEWMAHNWVKKGKIITSENDDNIENEVDEPNEIEYPTTARQREKTNTKRYKVEEWLRQLPRLPAHYCRKNTSKLYLEPVWESKIHLYKFYKDSCTNEGKDWVSQALFDYVFADLNFSLYSPRKDQCDTCCSFKAGNVNKEDWQAHVEQKNTARDEKEADKKLGKLGKIYCLSADLEAVKVTPFTRASAMYYKTKLCSHNYTIYNLANNQATCYWFNETEGDLSACTFASCLIDYLENHCLDPKLPIVIYTDGCVYQNRNQFLANALTHYTTKNSTTVTQKFLIKGHTQMECDSVHSLVERQLKNKDVYVPYEYVKHTLDARQSNPYEVKYLTHEFFKDFSKVQYYDSIRPGRVKGDPVVTDLRVLQYLPTGKIVYKLDFKDEVFKDLPRRPKKVEITNIPRLYESRLPVPDSKFKHLQELKFVIPADYHEFYSNIPHKP